MYCLGYTHTSGRIIFVTLTYVFLPSSNVSKLLYHLPSFQQLNHETSSASRQFGYSRKQRLRVKFLIFELKHQVQHNIFLERYKINKSQVWWYPTDYIKNSHTGEWWGEEKGNIVLSSLVDSWKRARYIPSFHFLYLLAKSKRWKHPPPQVYLVNFESGMILCSFSQADPRK